MKKLLGIFVLFTFVLFNACDDDDPKVVVVDDYDYSEILSSFVDNTIIPTYSEMKDNSKLLLEKTIAFSTSSSQADLDAACEYWVKTRAPWEAGEAFLFGPAAYSNLDPLLDSWPLDQTILQQVLDDNQELTADFVRNGLGAELRGFHAVEFLLFREGAARSAADVTDREKEYLTAVTEVLRDDCVKLWALWEGGSSEQALLDELEIEIGTPYGDEFKSAGNAGSRYLSQTDAVDEMIQGMMGIADEVANQKIANPASSGKPEEVESWFSWNSLTDFQDNIRSIENTYLGGYDASSRGKSLSAFVKEEDASLDTEVKAKITAAIAAIATIPEPFRNNLQDGNIQAAMDAINELENLISSKVRKLIVD